MFNPKSLTVLFVLSCQASAPTPDATSASPAEAASNENSIAQAPGKAAPGVTSDCANYATITSGSYEYINNMWARDKVVGAFEQCLISRQTDSKTELGWTWSWPGFDPLGFGYPEIVFGWKPWSDKSTDQRLPIRVDAVQRLAVRYAIETESTGKDSLAPAIWLTTSGEANRANALTISAEIVVWLDYPDGAAPIGALIGKEQVEGVAYEVWHKPNHGDKGNGQGWDLYYFKAPERGRQGTLHFHAFLAHMLGQRRIRPDHFVASVELGSELMGGSGTTWVREFEVDVARVEGSPRTSSN